MTCCGVTMEKSDATMRYRRLRTVANMRRILEVSLALLIISGWMPAAVKIAVEGLMLISECFYNPHVNFVIGNAIIILPVLLSRRSGGWDKSGTVDFVDEYVQNSEGHLRIASSASDLVTRALAIPPPTEVEEEMAGGEEEEMAGEEKRIVVPEKAATKSEDDAVMTALEEAKELLRRFQRTQSEKLKRELRVKPRRELVRSETEMKPRAFVSDVVTANSGNKCSKSCHSSPVDSLNSEEFRKTIEEFIAKHRRSLWEHKVTGDY